MNIIYDPNQLSLVAEFLRQGGVVAIPTETVYGLAADITQDNAIKRIFSLKNRPINHPLIVHISEISQLADLAVHVPDYVYDLAKVFWPGPLTMVLQKSSSVSDLVTGSQDTVAIRMPSHPLTRALIQLVGSPLAAPSANRFGRISPTSVGHVMNEFQGNVPVLDGGICSVGIESTIIDASSLKSCTLLRPGMISTRDIQKVLHHIELRAPHEGSRQAPGTLKHHYAPSKPNFLFHHADELEKICSSYDNSVYLLSLSDCYLQRGLSGYRMPDNPEGYAQQLYEQLRIADDASSKAIAIEMPPQTSAWSGIIDRLIKSTAKSSCP